MMDKSSGAAGNCGWDELSSTALMFAYPYPKKLARLHLQAPCVLTI